MKTTDMMTLQEHACEVLGFCPFDNGSIGECDEVCLTAGMLACVDDDEDYEDLSAIEEYITTSMYDQMERCDDAGLGRYADRLLNIMTEDEY